LIVGKKVVGRVYSYWWVRNGLFTRGGKLLTLIWALTLDISFNIWVQGRFSPGVITFMFKPQGGTSLSQRD